MASGGDKFNPGPEMRLDCSEILCNKVLLKYKGDRETFYHCEAARANSMTGGLDLTCGFPRNGKIPYPHQAAWSQPINMHPVRKRETTRGKLKSPQMAKFEKKARESSDQ